MTRKEHLDWAKERALQLLDLGRLEEAVNSLFSDMRKHKDLTDHPGITIGIMLMNNDKLSTDKDIRNWIEGFN